MSNLLFYELFLSTSTQNHDVISLIFFFTLIHLFYKHITVSPPSSSSLSSPDLIYIPPYPLHFCIHAERGRPPMEVNKAQITHDQAPPSASRLRKKLNFKIDSPKPMPVSGTGPDPSFRSSTNRPLKTNLNLAVVTVI